MKIIFNILIFLFLLSSCTQKKVFTISGNTMGTYYQVKIYTSDIDSQRLKQDLEKVLIDFNNIFSTYIEDSELSRINKAKANDKIELSKEMLDLLQEAKIISQKSQGSFDITIGPLVNAFGFGPNKEHRVPSEEEIKELKTYIGMDAFTIKDNILEKRNDSVYLDLSAIAKGAGVDKLINFLKSKDFKDVLVEIGGEIRAIGSKGKSSWNVGIEKPNFDKEGTITRAIQLKDKSIATSGSYRNFFKSNDKTLSHTVDPRTGYPVEHSLISVTVISDTCTDADAWATALMVLGPIDGLEIVEKYNIPAYFLVMRDNGIKAVSSSKMIELL